jgi:alditol oxidase
MAGMRPASAAVTNWAGNIVFSARAVHRPRSLDQLAELVGSSDRLRVLGSGHSFSPVADTDGDLVSLADLPPRCEIDGDSVTVGAGMRYGDVMAPLHAAGRALRNTGSLPHIAVAGACATGTHGSGDANRVLAASVSAVELLGRDGRARTVRRGDDGFDGSVVALGALGVVTALTLDTVDAFDVRQTVVEGLRRLRDAPEALAAAYSVSLFTYWEGNGFEQVWVKQRADEPPLPAGWLGTTPAPGPRHMTRGEDAACCTQQGGVVVPWYEGLPHFRLDFTPSSGEELQSEWLVPRASLVDALHALDAIRTTITPVLLVCEVRTVAADSTWISAAAGRESAALHFTWVPDTPAVTPVVAAVEAALAPFAARPHWGKVFTACRDDIAPLWPRLGEFAQLVRAADPAAKFRNAFLDRYLPT